MCYLFLAVLVFILLDVISGVAAAAKSGELQSTVMRQGLYHKCGEILLMILAVAGEYVTTLTGLTDVIPTGVFNAVAVYIITMEVISILENIGKLNSELDIKYLSKLFGKNKTEE